MKAASRLIPGVVETASRPDSGPAHAPPPGPPSGPGPRVRRRGPPVFLVLALLLVGTAFLIVRYQLAAVVFALALGYLLHPLYRWMLRGVRKPWISASVVLLLVLSLLLAPFVVLAWQFLEDATRFVASIESREDVGSRIEEVLGSLGLPERHVGEASTRVLESGAALLRDAAVPVATLATEFVVSLLVFFILLFYVLVDGPRLVRYLEHVLPAPDGDVRRMLDRVGSRVHAITLGTVVVAVVQATIAGLGWWILGLPAPVFWAFVLLVLELVPVLGSFLVLLPAAAWSFAQGDWVAGVGLLVLNFVMVGLIDDFLRPYLIGRRSGVHPALILLGIVGGLPLFGVSGFIVGPLLMGLVGPMFQVWSHPEDDEGPRSVD